MASTDARELEPGAAAFYGVRPGWRHLWEQAQREGRDWYYLDNSLFDVVREQQFRVAKNAIQPSGAGESDGRRFAALGIEVKPMRPLGSGTHVVIAAQSPEFMSCVAGDPGWLERVTLAMRARFGAAHVIVRTKPEARPLIDDLKGARMLVTWSSAAAVTALLEGVRVGCAPQCCATHADDRERWAGVLADSQWTLDEMRDGTAWRALIG